VGGRGTGGPELDPLPQRADVVVIGSGLPAECGDPSGARRALRSSSSTAIGSGRELDAFGRHGMECQKAGGERGASRIDPALFSRLIGETTRAFD